MTAQRREHLVYNNKEYYLTTEPLHLYLKDNNISFRCCTTQLLEGVCGLLEYRKEQALFNGFKGLY